MRYRKHHNNKGLTRIKRGRTTTTLRHISKKIFGRKVKLIKGRVVKLR